VQDAGGTQNTIGTIIAAGLEPDTGISADPDPGTLAVSYGPVLVYVHDQAALGSLLGAWRQAAHRAGAVGLPAYAPGPGHGDPSMQVGLLTHARGRASIDVVALARGVAPDGIPTVRVRVGNLLTRAYDQAAVLQITGLWEQAAAHTAHLPTHPGARAGRRRARR
jgi:hypothetical protein